MSDTALENAQVRRDELARQINALQQQIEDLKREARRVEAFITDWHSFAGTTDVPSADVKPSNVINAKHYRHNSKKEEVARHVRELLEAAGRPMSRSELYPRLVERGLTIWGTDPEMVLSTMLWRMREPAKIARLKSGGYWLADKANPAAGYDPDIEEFRQTDEALPDA